MSLHYEAPRMPDPVCDQCRSRIHVRQYPTADDIKAAEYAHVCMTSDVDDMHELWKRSA
jgi:hypothetical protein